MKKVYKSSFSIRLILATLCLVSFVSCVSNSNETHIKVISKLIDLGDVKLNSHAEGVFMLVNTGESDLVIKDVVADCHCTVPNWERKNIVPSDTTRLQVVYDTKNPGYFQQKISVESNAMESPILLILRGKVVD